MVRERACTAIAELLVDSDNSANVRSHLLRWISEQRLESLAAIGLLVLIRAKGLSNDFELLSPAELSHCITKPSLLSWLLLQELYDENSSEPDRPTLNSSPAPDGFQGDPFFLKYIKMFVPPIYSDNAHAIGQLEKIHFFQQWSFEWQQLVAELGAEPSADSFHIHGYDDSEHYVAFDTKLSEVYRSAYLRSLAWAIAEQHLSSEEAVEYGLIACPSDIGLWYLKPGPRPDWWPQAVEPEGKIDTIPGQIWPQIEALWGNQRNESRDWLILEAGGRVHAGNMTYDLDVFGVFQQYLGDEHGNANLEEMAHACRTELFASYEPASLLRFGGTIAQVSAQRFARRFGNWGVIPASFQLNPQTTPRWQFWRVYRGFWVPAPFLAGDRDLDFSCTDEAVITRNQEGLVAEWRDWAHGLREKMNANLSPATGQYLRIKREKIRQFEAETGTRFCWVCRLTGFDMRHSYGPFKTIYDHRDFGSTRLLTGRSSIALP